MKEENTLKSKAAQREEEILKFWQENNIFQKSLEKESPKGEPKKEFVFYDGPPFATGEPHYGHMLAGSMKDAIPRYKTMQGNHVRRVWGWDCHGLPVENLIEKELNLGNKKDIENYGIDKFNKAARESVLRYEESWKKFVPRSGRWVDMENAYKTMDSKYTESVWWSFKTLFDKGLIYEGFKVMPYCPHCGTSLSNFEVNQGYKDISDISVYVKFKVKSQENTFLLAWTTTPWTLPGNVALAVGEEIEYVKIKVGEEFLIVAKELAEGVLKEKTGEIIQEIKGKDLFGLEYEPVFGFYSKDENLKNKENAWKVYGADFVTTEEGTGIVHIAPAFGSDDYELSQKENLPFIQHVDGEGKMKAEVKGFEGLSVKPKSSDEKERIATDIEIIKHLQSAGAYFDKKKITHSYPHCWRCDTPLLNYATSSWFVRVTQVKDKMMELNASTHWVPEAIGENRFGKWLEGARDWAISRSRFWGAPLPVWENKKGERIVIGSIESLKNHTKKSGNNYFVMRHGETEGNVKKVWNTKLDVVDPLTENGKRGIIENISKIKNVDIIFTSPFDRTKETAHIVADNIGLSRDAVVVDSRLAEWNVGAEFDGTSLEEYFKVKDRYADYDSKVDGAESYADVIRRTGDFIYDVEKKYSNKTILIITHGAPLHTFLFLTQGFSFDHLVKGKHPFVYLDNAEIKEINFTPLPHNENYELDLHKPYIDEVELVDEEGNKLTRVKEVFDTWYDSGSMPFASIHYPFEHAKEFEEKNSSFFPADFIAEGLDQTRGWFYTLLVLGTALFQKSPYKNVIVNGIVLAEDGQKMSKKMKNYPDPYLMFDKYGADAVRYYLLSSPVMRAEDLTFSEKGLDEVSKKIFARLENILSFYEMYADKTFPMSDMGKSQNVLDLWLSSRLNELGEKITVSLEAYELDKATRPILDFVDDFSTWYVRRSRERFKSDNREDKNAALGTTRFVLLTLAKYMAPFTPFFAEYVYRELRQENDPENNKESVHLTSWPFDKTQGKSNEEVIKKMAEVRRIVSLGLEKRNTANIKVRQPLSSLTVVTEEKLGEEYIELIKDEVNVKEVIIGEIFELDTTITPELQKEGDAREFIRAVQELRKVKNLTPDQKIFLLVEASEEGKSFLEEYKTEIIKPTNISDFNFVSNEGTEVKAGEFTFRIDVSQT